MVSIGWVKMSQIIQHEVKIWWLHTIGGRTIWQYSVFDNFLVGDTVIYHMTETKIRNIMKNVNGTIVIGDKIYGITVISNLVQPAISHSHRSANIEIVYIPFN